MMLNNKLVLILLICTSIFHTATAGADPFAELDQGVVEENAKFKKDMAKISPEQRKVIEYMKSHNGQLPPWVDANGKPIATADRPSHNPLPAPVLEKIHDPIAPIKVESSSQNNGVIKGCPNLISVKTSKGVINDYLNACIDASRFCTAGDLDDEYKSEQQKAKEQIKCNTAKGKLAILYPEYIKAIPANSDLNPASPPEQLTVKLNTPPIKQKTAEKVSSKGCGRMNEYVFCNDGNIYEKVAPSVAVQLQKEYEGSLDGNRSYGKDVSRDSSQDQPRDASGREK